MVSARGCIMRARWMVAAVLALAGAAWAAGPEKASPARPPAETCKLTHCLVTMIDEVDVPAQEAGLLVSVEARAGLSVESGLLLAQIDDRPVRHALRVAELEHEAASAKAASDVNSRHARATSAVAKADFDAVAAANRRNPGTIAQTEQRKKELELQTTVLRIEQSELEQRLAEIAGLSTAAEAEAAQAAIDRRQVRAPLDGVVVDVPRRPGEWVQVGERVARIVRMDRLRIEGFVKADEFDAAEIHARPVTVDVRLARGRIEQFAGKITFVDPAVEASNDYRVWAEVENRQQAGQWLLRPGQKVEMTIDVAE